MLPSSHKSYYKRAARFFSPHITSKFQIFNTSHGRSLYERLSLPLLAALNAAPHAPSAHLHQLLTRITLLALLSVDCFVNYTCAHDCISGHASMTLLALSKHQGSRMSIWENTWVDHWLTSGTSCSLLNWYHLLNSTSRELDLDKSPNRSLCLTCDH